MTGSPLSRLDAPFLYDPRSVLFREGPEGSELLVLARAHPAASGPLAGRREPFPLGIAYRFNPRGANTGVALLAGGPAPWLAPGGPLEAAELEAIRGPVLATLAGDSFGFRVYLGRGFRQFLFCSFLRCAQILCGIGPCFGFIREQRRRLYRPGGELRCFAVPRLPVSPTVTFLLQPRGRALDFVLRTPLPPAMERALLAETAAAMRAHPGHFYRSLGLSGCEPLPLPPGSTQFLETNHA